MTVLWLWQERARGKGASLPSLMRTAAWALATVTLPWLATIWWMKYAEAVRSLNATADFLGDSNMYDYYFGTGQRFSTHIWRQHLVVWLREIVSVEVFAGAGLLALFFARRWLIWIAVLVGFFLAVQLIFPVLYAWHEYYFVANGFMLLLAVGLVACGVLESRLPRILAWGLILALQTGQIWAYLQVHYPEQRAPSRGGSPMMQVLRLATEANDVLIAAGNDWSSITPYFSQRRALMIRGGMDHDEAGLASAFARLKGESVGALILHGTQRDNEALLERAVRDFGIDPHPVFTCLDATIYMHGRLRLLTIPLVKEVPDAQFLELTAQSKDSMRELLGHEVELAALPAGHRRNFTGMSPLPIRYYTTYGAGRTTVAGRVMFSAHPDTRLWFNAAAGRHDIEIEILLPPAAYDESVPYGDRSDGVDLIISIESSDHLRRQIFSRWLNPRDNPGDRGLQTIKQPFDLKAGEVVVVEVGAGPLHNASRDWAVLGRVEIR